MGGIGRKSWRGGGLWIRFKLALGAEFVFRVGVEIGYMLGKAFRYIPLVSLFMLAM
jgi:hypothetical protein